jgi:serine/threonine protein kinase
MDLPRPFGPYTLLRRLAVGGMAEIYIAKARGLGGFEKLLALKLVHPHLSADPSFIQMLVDEAKILVLLTHANVAQVFDLGNIDGTYYIAMEYVEGLDVHALQQAAQRAGEQLPLPVCCYVTAEILNGLDYAHRKRDAAGKPLNIVHRDISPQNMLISAAGEVKLVDFGIAKTSSRGEGTEVGIIKGKYYYMSPEQAWADPMDRRSDIFSAGIVLYEMLTGRMLYNAQTIPELIGKVREAEIAPPHTLRAEIPERLSAVVMKALSRDPEQRFQSSLDMGEALRDFLYEHAPAFNAGRLAQYVQDLLEAASRVVEMKPDADATGGLRALTRNEFIRNENSVVFGLANVLATRSEGLPPKLRKPGEPPLIAAPIELTPPSGQAPARPAGRPSALTPPGSSFPTHGRPAVRAASLPAAPPLLPSHITQRPREKGRAVPPPVPQAAQRHDSAPPTEIMNRPPAFSRAVSAWPYEAPTGDAGDDPTELWPVAEVRARLADPHFRGEQPNPAGRAPLHDPFSSPVFSEVDGATSKYRPSTAIPIPDPTWPPTGNFASLGPEPMPSLTPALPFGSTGKPALVPPPGESPSLGPIPPSPLVPDFGSQDAIVRVPRRSRVWIQVLIGVAFTVLGVFVFELTRPTPVPATLEIISDPSGASVKVNGALQPHRTPIKLTGLQAGNSYELRVERTGFLPWEATYRASAGSVQHIAVLKPIMAELHVTSKPSGAQVWLDDVMIGRTPLTVPSLPVGRRVRLRASTPSYPEARREITIEEDDLKPVVDFAFRP